MGIMAQWLTYFLEKFNGNNHRLFVARINETMKKRINEFEEEEQ
jgi:hypothetical protein